MTSQGDGPPRPRAAPPDPAPGQLWRTGRAGELPRVVLVFAVEDGRAYCQTMLIGGRAPRRASAWAVPLARFTGESSGFVYMRQAEERDYQ